ncbi:MAG: hypothetical protein ABF479_13135 [Gluconacetobacter sp.]
MTQRHFAKSVVMAVLVFGAVSQAAARQVATPDPSDRSGPSI